VRIEQLMQKKLGSVTAEQSLDDAARVLWERDCGCVPVVSEDGSHRVVGMLTDRDICMAAYTQGCTLRDRSVGSAMSRDVETCAPGDSVSVAEERMRKNQVRRLPVIDGGRLVGIVSLNDLAITATRSKSGKGDQLLPADVAATLAGICQHRQPTALAAQ
jgi:CBS domain-containing protein